VTLKTLLLHSAGLENLAEFRVDIRAKNYVRATPLLIVSQGKPSSLAQGLMAEELYISELETVFSKLVEIAQALPIGD
jgi:hypothetical protein